MKFLHMAQANIRYIASYINMIRDNFEASEHHFFYYDGVYYTEMALLEDEYSFAVKGETIKEQKKHMKSIYPQYDIIIWHGFVGSRKLRTLLFDKSALNKSVWIMHGIDLYNWKKRGITLAAFKVNIVNKLVREKVKYISSIFPTDEAVFRKLFPKSTAKCFFTPYPLSESVFEELRTNIYTLPRSNGETWIQVGNNAFAFNRHIETLDILSKFSREKIKIFIPLSYGFNRTTEDTQTIGKVNAYTAIPIEKIEVLYKLMPTDEYSTLLYNIDIGIFPAKRQNALGNIYRILYAGGKVFLSKENPVFNFFIGEGIEVFALESIENMPFEAFIKPSDNTKAREFINRQHHPDNNVLFWEKMFVELGGSGIKKVRKENEEKNKAAISPRAKADFIDLSKYNFIDEEKGNEA